MSNVPQHLRVPKGLAGVSVTDTKISKSEADGTLLYRGYAISDLVANAGFEETAFLVLNGSFPRKEELEAFTQELRKKAPVQDKVFGIMRELGKTAHPIDALRTAVSSLGSTDREETIDGKQFSLESKMSVLAANCYRVPRGERPTEPVHEPKFSDNLLHMLTKKERSDYERWVFERVLIFYMEHDMNASTFTVRVVASTLADPYAAATAGLAALKGPLHGGANEEAMKMLLEIGEPSKAAAYVERALREGKKVIGFGHRVYKDFDPRARLCKEYLGEILAKRGEDDRLYRLCDAIENEMWERKRIPPNLDYYAAPIFYLLDIDVPLFTPIFAASRTFGWMAHYNEQLEDNKLIRPDATYVGPSDLKYAPVERR
jgi:citrate synthase